MLFRSLQTADIPDFSSVAEIFAARGGGIIGRHYAIGGGTGSDDGDTDAPEGIYKPVGPGINIPDELSKAKLDPAKPPPGQNGSGLGDVASLVGTAAKIIPFFFATGGVVPRIGFADGGPSSNDNQPSDDELAIRTIMSEVGRDKKGNINPQEALGIGAVIMNRARQRGLSPGDVVLQPKQFEPWNVQIGRAHV